MSFPAEWFGVATAEEVRHRREMRERALYNATNLHCETGDAMAILDRETAVADVLATADQSLACARISPTSTKPFEGCTAVVIDHGLEMYCRCHHFTPTEQEQP